MKRENIDNQYIEDKIYMWKLELEYLHNNPTEINKEREIMVIEHIKCIEYVFKTDLDQES